MGGSSPPDANFDDDGEENAGTRLQKLLHTEGALDVLVVVSRWYGGVNIGRARFQHICTLAQSLLRSSKNLPCSPMATWGSGQRLEPNCPQSVPADVAARREQAAAAAERRAAAFSARGGLTRSTQMGPRRNSSFK